jgi:hypothetical protein
MPVERGYRDSRINRIFEGTNEINRLIVVDTAMKRAMKGDYDLFGQAESLYSSLDSISDGKVADESYFAEKSRYIRNFKKVVLLAIHGATKHFDKKFVQEQEVMNNISDMIMEIYVSESLFLRVKKLEAVKGENAAGIYKNILDINIYEASAKIRKAGHDAVNSFAVKETAEKLKHAIDILSNVGCINVKEIRRAIADKLIGENDYTF